MRTTSSSKPRKATVTIESLRNLETAWERHQQRVDALSRDGELGRAIARVVFQIENEL